jgi:tetratricopeptide (TPR) repeat protein
MTSLDANTQKKGLALAGTPQKQMKRVRRQAIPETPVPPARDSFIWPAAAIFAVALLVRVVHIWQIHRAPFFSVLMGDARGYDAWAQRIAAGDWIGTEVFYQAPLYPYFLGTIYAVAGRSLLLVRICQALVGSAACVLLALAARRLFSKTAGLVAGVALALYAPAIFFDSLIQKSVLDVFFVCLTIWLMSAILTSGARASLARSDRTVGAEIARPVLGGAGSAPIRLWLFLGLAMGALALTRENALVLVAVILLWALVERPSSTFRTKTNTRAVRQTQGTPHRSGLAAAGSFVLGLAIVLAPVAIRNFAVGGGFYLTTSQFGSNLYIGNNPRSDGTYMSLRYGRGAPEYERQDATELAEKAVGRSLTPAEVSSFWTDRAMAFVTSQPGAWLRLLGRKFLLLWNADEMLDTESQETYAEWSVPLRVLSWIGHFGVLAPLALFGAWIAWPDRRRLWVFYAMTLAYAASVILFYVFARYRFPLVPFLVLFASYGIRSSPGFLRAPGWGRRSLALAATAAMAILANWPVLSTTTMKAITENNLATAFQEDGRLDEAIAHYRRSIELRSDYAPAYNNLGAALRAKGQVDEAVASYERALLSQPDYTAAHYNLANALLDKNKPDEAATHFRIALASIPGSAGTHNNLGIALASQGKVEEAVAEFRAALEAEPDSAKTHRNLGNALSSMGREQEAIEHLRRAAALDPKDAAAHYDLGSDLLQANRPEEAAAEFREALTLDPTSAAAHNNLGIALASMGRVAEAIGEFQRALALQPDYAEARRNLEIGQTQKKGAGR